MLHHRGAICHGLKEAHEKNHVHTVSDGRGNRDNMYSFILIQVFRRASCPRCTARVTPQRNKCSRSDSILCVAGPEARGRLKQEKPVGNEDGQPQSQPGQVTTHQGV